jgi:hypothetical protein
MLAGNSVIIAFISLFMIGSTINSNISFLFSPVFSQELDMSINGSEMPANSSQINRSSFMLNGRISSMLMPTMAGMNDNVMSNSTSMSQMMSNDNTSPITNDSVASKAMRYSMARDVAWILSGDWILVSSPTGSDNKITTTFDAEFTKVTTNGTMSHTHRINNFVPLTNTSDIAAALNSNTSATTIIGKADVYFNDQLAWPQAGTTLSIANGSVLTIDLDSEDIDHHFHDQPIYGTVNKLSNNDDL